jgi:enoyl-CoA hydratase/carnithine racemase
VVTPEQLEQTVESLAAEIASKSTYTLALGKQAFYRQRHRHRPRRADDPRRR